MIKSRPLTLDVADLAAIHAQQLSAEEIQRQRDLLAGQATYRHLDRPAMLGDGIRQLSDSESQQCLADFRKAALAGRYLSFVPASGAASRMFKTFMAALNSKRPLDRKSLELSTNPEDQDVLTIFGAIDQLAIREVLAQSCQTAPPLLAERLALGDYASLARRLLEPAGLNLPAEPKGLLPFHLYPAGARTAFEEHLHEATALLADEDGAVSVHFTVSPQHQNAFSETLDRVRAAIEQENQIKLTVTFSTQSAATDTIALDSEDQLFRNDDGSLLFRPGGHGSLLRNLDELDGDFVFIKNIDNIVPDDRRHLVLHWRQILGGLLAQLQKGTLFWIEQLSTAPRDSSVRTQAARFIQKELGIRSEEPEEKLLTEVRDRPMRVCGVVANTGDPGGGPFWVRSPDGALSLQIVETAEIDPEDSAQTRHLGTATHFNPTDMVCALRTADGQPLDLAAFVDRDAVFVAQKSSEGRDLRALEHPGLWNGSMAGWTTVFVEVPRETFQPVKSLLDLLGTGHAPKA
jgi:hypothetical protein